MQTAVVGGIESGGVSQDYGRLLNLDRAGWAWEWLRRNPAYRAEFASQSARPLESLCAISIDQEETDRAGRWGLAFAEHPNLDASAARVLWRADYDPNVLIARAIATSADDPDRFAVERFACA